MPRFLLVLTFAALSMPLAAAPVLLPDASANPALFDLPVGAVARLALPGGRSFDVEVEAPLRHASGNVSFRGRIAAAGVDGYTVTITRNPAGFVFGTLFTPAGEFRLAPKLARVTPVRGVQRRDTVAHFPTARGDAVLPSAKSHTETSEFNLLIRYDFSVRGAMDEAAWETYLDNLMATTNAAYANSGTRVRFERVADQPDTTTRTSVDNEDALTEFRSANAEEWRYDLGAHFVTLLRPHRAGDTCGAAHIPACGDDAACYGEELGYSVVAVGPECSGLALAHQLGHNLGAAHEPAEGQDGAYPYAHAHIAGTASTVMAFNTPAANLVAQFSDPTVSTCGGAACGVDEVSDNVRTILQTRHHAPRWFTDRSLEIVSAPEQVLSGDDFTLAFEWFGVIGTRFDIELYRDGTLEATLADGQAMLSGVRSVQIPEDLPPAAYTVRVTSMNEPSLHDEAPLTVVAPPEMSEVAFTTEQVVATGSSASITVHRTGSLEGEASVEYTPLGGAATVGVNYAPFGGTLNWAAGDGSAKTITVTGLHAAESGNDLAIIVVLRNPTGDAEVGDLGTASIIIPGRAGEAGGGGGGAFGWAALLSLLLLRGARRQAARV